MSTLNQLLILLAYVTVGAANARPVYTWRYRRTLDQHRSYTPSERTRAARVDAVAFAILSILLWPITAIIGLIYLFWLTIRWWVTADIRADREHNAEIQASIDALWDNVRGIDENLKDVKTEADREILNTSRESYVKTINERKKQFRPV